MIEFKGIHKSYDQQEVLKGVDTTFLTGKITMLLGASGCGKSTMIKLINRLIEPDKGEILIHGKAATTIKPEILRRQIGYAIQGIGLFPHMTVRQNIGVVPKLLKWEKSKINTRVEELMDLMDIPYIFGEKKPSMLSGGEAQRIGVARALGANPEILLMDEPFGALDPLTRSRLQQEFISLQQKLKKTVVFVTHDVGEAIRMADQLVLINDGRVIGDGSPESIALHEDMIVKTFFGDLLTFELLEKYSPANYPHVFFQRLLKEDDILYKQKALDQNGSFKEMIALMLKQGASEVGVEVKGQIYKVSFDDVVKAFGGGQIGR